MPQTRIAFADTNWLFSLYYRTQDSRAISAWAEKGSSTLVVSAAVLAECRCNFWRAGDRLAAFETDLAGRLYLDCGYTFEELVYMARDLFRRYAPRSNVGTLDLLHVAAARRFGCQWFLSFDSASGCRAVAHDCGLKLFPELKPEDRAWLRRIGRSRS
jgi:predicted nucleic acid-binding protein